MITIENDGVTMVQGRTELNFDETFLHGRVKSIDATCRICSRPFSESLQKNGIVLDAVVCSGCSQDMAFVVRDSEVK